MLCKAIEKGINDERVKQTVKQIIVELQLNFGKHFQNSGELSKAKEYLNRARKNGSQDAALPLARVLIECREDSQSFFDEGLNVLNQEAKHNPEAAFLLGYFHNIDEKGR